jgi:hypothetical protein
MEAASTSESSVNFYQTTQRNNPENSHLHSFILMTELVEELSLHWASVVNCVLILVCEPQLTTLFQSITILLTLLTSTLHKTRWEEYRPTAYGK